MSTKEGINIEGVSFRRSGQEVDPSSINVHGVTISSRYGVARELMEMLEFLQEAKKENLVHMLCEMFYDSSNSYCDFIPHDRYKGIVNDRTHPLFRIAREYISQFEWAGEMWQSVRSEMGEVEGPK